MNDDPPKKPRRRKPESPVQAPAVTPREDRGDRDDDSPETSQIDMQFPGGRFTVGHGYRDLLLYPFIGISIAMVVIAIGMAIAFARSGGIKLW